MANHKTGAQRYNDRMHKIFEQAKVNGKKYGTENSSTWGGQDMRSDLMKKTQAKSKALAKKKNKSSWSSGKTECNMCSKTTPHTHFK